MHPGLPQRRVVSDNPPWTMVSAATRSLRSRICLLIYTIVSHAIGLVHQKTTSEHDSLIGKCVFTHQKPLFLRRKVTRTAFAPSQASGQEGRAKAGGGQGTFLHKALFYLDRMARIRQAIVVEDLSSYLQVNRQAMQDTAAATEV